MITGIQLRQNMVILFRGDPHRLLSVQHLALQNRRGMIITKLRNLKTGTGYEHRFQSEDKLERVVLEPRQMEYLYRDEDQFWFMDTQTYEQIGLGKDVIGEVVDYLLLNTQVTINYCKGVPLDIELPLTVKLKVTETEPNLKGATATASPKAATLETGLVIQVPRFIEIGNTVEVDTREGKYLSRA